MRLPGGTSILEIVLRGRVGACAALLLGVACLAVPACGLSVGGLESVDASAGADATTRDALLDSPVDASGRHDAREAGNEAASDAEGDAPVADAGADAAPDVAVDSCGSVEICNNGVDDDCNGLVDCADPQCQSLGWACMPAVPASWVLVAYDPVGRPACAAGWGSSVPLVEDPDAGAPVCTCACGGPLANGCENGVATLSLGQDACACSAAQNLPLVSDGGCDPLGTIIGPPCSSWSDGLVKPIGPAPVACADDPQVPPITFGAQGESCVPLENAGGGCPSGSGCLPGPAPAAPCVEAAGVQACPSGFTRQHVVYDPTNVVDQRQCGACGCTTTPTSCADASLTLYDDPACGQNPVVLQVDGGCDSFHGNPSDAGWFRYSAIMNAPACSSEAGTTSLDGGLVLRAPATICCP